MTSLYLLINLLFGGFEDHYYCFNVNLKWISLQREQSYNDHIKSFT